jgi:soluble lytic murein transglycosylase-like protein
MRNLNRAATLAFLGMALAALPAKAQIASYVDDGGKLIYTYDGPPTAHHGSSMKAQTPLVEQIRALSNGTSGAVASKANVGAGVGAGLGAVSPSVNGADAKPTDSRPTDSKPSDSKLDQIVQDAAGRHQVDPALVKAVIATESGWNSQAVSQKGAMGLMQLVPATAQRFGVGNPFDPAQNVEGGTTYLRSLLDRYNGDLTKSIAAYNAGERAVDQSRGVPAYRETQQYVQKVTSAYFKPGSGRNSTLWTPPRAVVRQEVDANGRVVFTNE